MRGSRAPLGGHVLGSPAMHMRTVPRTQEYPSALTHGRRRLLESQLRMGEPCAILLYCSPRFRHCADRERLRSRRGAEPKAAPLPQVSVAPVISRKVTESDEFTGRFEAVERSRSGRASRLHLSVNFTEGSEVKRATCCWSSTPRPYRRSATRRARGSHRRARSWCSPSPSATGRRVSSPARDLAEEYDTARRARAGASQRRGRAGALDAAALNVTFTRLTAPISGRISRALVTSGNFVTNGRRRSRLWCRSIRST